LRIIAQIVTRFGETREPPLAKPEIHRGICRCISGKGGNKILIDLMVIHALQSEIEDN
jgi:hypothetical protein